MKGEPIDMYVVRCAIGDNVYNMYFSGKKSAEMTLPPEIVPWEC